MRDLELADRIRSKGVRVVEVDGWRDRGSSDFNPGGAVWHHTAGPSSGATPSLNMRINGRPDLAGPLCNVMQSREPDGNDIAYVIAAGRANHAGSGGWAGLAGNSSVYGLEVEHTGVAPLMPHSRKDIAVRIVAAMVQGRADEHSCCQHSEWTSRKIDIANDTDPNWYRTQCGMYLRGTGGITPPPDIDGEFTVDAEAEERFDKLERMIDSVGTALNRHIEQLDDEAMNITKKVDSVGAALNLHIEQLDDHDKHMENLLGVTWWLVFAWFNLGVFVGYVLAAMLSENDRRH